MLVLVLGYALVKAADSKLENMEITPVMQINLTFQV
jgi:hypothetical protein